MDYRSNKYPRAVWTVACSLIPRVAKWRQSCYTHADEESTRLTFSTSLQDSQACIGETLSLSKLNLCSFTWKFIFFNDAILVSSWMPLSSIYTALANLLFTINNFFFSFLFSTPTVSYVSKIVLYTHSRIRSLHSCLHSCWTKKNW